MLHEAEGFWDDDCEHQITWPVTLAVIIEGGGET